MYDAIIDKMQLWHNFEYWATLPHPSDVNIGKYVKLAFIVKLLIDTLDTTWSQFAPEITIASNEHFFADLKS